MERAVRLLADPKTSVDAKAEHDFLRGVIYAADHMIEMPSVLKQKVESMDKINSAPKIRRANGAEITQSTRNPKWINKTSCKPQWRAASASTRSRCSSR